MVRERGAQAPQLAPVMAGYWGSIPVERPRPLGDFTRFGPHQGEVRWYEVTTEGGWQRPTRRIA
jgi:hypothetical protein